MNDQTERLLRQLEQATCPLDEVPDAAIDAADDETQMLRDSWLALAQLLGARDASIETPVLPDPMILSRARPARWWTLAASVAATVLIVVGGVAIWWSQRDATPGSTIADANSSFSSRDVSREAPVTPEAPSVASAEVRSPASSSDEVTESAPYAWDDSLDDLLTETAYAIRDARAGNSGDTRYDVMLTRLRQFEAELDSGL